MVFDRSSGALWLPETTPMSSLPPDAVDNDDVTSVVTDVAVGGDSSADNVALLDTNDDGCCRSMAEDDVDEGNVSWVAVFFIRSSVEVCGFGSGPCCGPW